MTSYQANLQLPPHWLDKQDTDFFKRFPTRKAHIRKPFGAECDAEFRTLGDHKPDRRRIVLWRVPEDNPFYERLKHPILKLPVLLFAEETVEDEDANLLPMIDSIMREAAL
jgi:hypothetical protein